MQAGQLRDWLVFEKKTIKDSTTVWKNDFEDWGSFSVIDTTEVQQDLDGIIISRQFARFTVRYRPGISGATHRIIFEDKVWNILEPVHDPRRTSLTIDATWTDPTIQNK